MTIDISNELQISRFGNGIKLSRSENSSCQNTVGNIFNLPFPVYLNIDHRIIKCNDVCADLNGFISTQDAINKKWYTTYNKSTITDILKNQESVINDDQFKIIEDNAVRRDGAITRALSFKMPWYNKENKIIGIFGCSIWLNNHSIAESLMMVNKLGFLNTSNPMLNHTIPAHTNLSKRQLECLKLLVRGKTAREIAETLCLSTRTVEHYLENIKSQMHVSKKSELIDKVYDWFN